MFNLFKFLKKYRNKNNVLIFFINIFFIVFLGFVDYYTGHELVFAIFYLIIVSFAVFLTTTRYGIIISVFAALVGLLVDISYTEKYANVMYPILNNTFRLCYYIVHSILLSKLLYLYRKSSELSLIDPLTNISNFRSFRMQFQYEVEKSSRTKLPISLAYFDIDNFKFINDNYGHSTGDVLLQTVTSEIKKIIRPMDVIARLGGDEFALLLPETDLENARTVVKRLQDEVSNIANKNNWPITLSIGVVIFRETTLMLDEMIKIADTLMYQIKSEGKNNIKFKIYPEAMEKKI